MASPSGADGGAAKMKPKINLRKGSLRRNDTSDSAPMKGDIGGADLDDKDLDQALSIRIRERDPDEPPGGRMGRPSSRLGQLFRDQSPAAIKESIKRPFSSLLKRPGSRSGGRNKGRPSGADDAAAAAPVAIDDQELEELSAPDGVQRPPSGRRADDRPMPPTTGGLFSAPTAGARASDSAANGAVGRSGAVRSVRAADRESSPEIPQLEEALVDEFGTEVAQAPSMAVHRVADYHELDNELMKHAAFATLEDIDLSLLTRFLCPESEVRDEVVPWTWDYLYTSVCSELREEWADEAVDGDAADADRQQRSPGVA